MLLGNNEYSNPSNFSQDNYRSYPESFFLFYTIKTGAGLKIRGAAWVVNQFYFISVINHQSAFLHHLQFFWQILIGDG
jgi:hypothetical protein